jgi:hypothetical protein
MLIATTAQVDGQFVLHRTLDRAPGSTEYTDIDNKTAACWHLRRLDMHLGTMQRSGCYFTAACHILV